MGFFESSEERKKRQDSCHHDFGNGSGLWPSKDGKNTCKKCGYVECFHYFGYHNGYHGPYTCKYCGEFGDDSYLWF